MNLEISKTCADRVGLLENIIQERKIFVEDEDFRLAEDRLTVSDVTISDVVREDEKLLSDLKGAVEQVLMLYYDAEEQETLSFSVKEGSALYDFLPEKHPSGMALISLFTKNILKIRTENGPRLTVSKLFREDVLFVDDVLTALCRFLFPADSKATVVAEESAEPVVRTQVLKKGLSITNLYHFDFEDAMKHGEAPSKDVIRSLSETKRERRIRTEREETLADISALIKEIETKREG